jgi:hypothetical protein
MTGIVDLQVETQSKLGMHMAACNVRSWLVKIYWLLVRTRGVLGSKKINHCFKIYLTRLRFLPWQRGWCSISALGNVNLKKGRHFFLLYFWIFIYFTSGSRIIIPFALIKHSNIPISDGETRYSVAQYSARGLFRCRKTIL